MGLPCFLLALLVVCTAATPDRNFDLDDFFNSDDPFDVDDFDIDAEEAFEA